MKRKLLYISLAAIIFFTSTGFGFLESPAVIHRKANKSIKTDSVNINTVNMSLKNTSISQKEIQKPTHELLTKSVIQWVANAVKNTVEKIVAALSNILQSIILNLIRLFTK